MNVNVKDAAPIYKFLKSSKRGPFGDDIKWNFSKFLVDKQGRVVVPPKLAARAGLEREVVVVGVYDHLEIWDRTAWTEHLHAVEGRVDDVAERLAEKRS